MLYFYTKRLELSFLYLNQNKCCKKVSNEIIHQIYKNSYSKSILIGLNFREKTRLDLCIH